MSYIVISVFSSMEEAKEYASGLNEDPSNIRIVEKATASANDCRQGDCNNKMYAVGNPLPLVVVIQEV